MGGVDLREVWLPEQDHVTPRWTREKSKCKIVLFVVCAFKWASSLSELKRSFVALNEGIENNGVVSVLSVPLSSCAVPGSASFSQRYPDAFNLAT